MFYSCTDGHNKKVIMDSLSSPDCVVRVVFATMALSMGVDIKNLFIMEHLDLSRTILKTVAELVDSSNRHYLETTGNRLKLISITTFKSIVIMS